VAVSEATERELAYRERLTARLRRLSEVAQEFAATTADPSALLALITRRIADVMGEACAIRLSVERDQDWAAPWTAYDPDPTRAEKLKDALAQDPTVLATATGAVVLTASSEIIARSGLKTLVFAPLRAHGKIRGTCIVYRADSD
jgi:hypothetical protein